MIALLSQLIAAVVQSLPRIFLLGAPVLLAAIGIAALLDARIPGNAGGDSAG